MTGALCEETNIRRKARLYECVLTDGSRPVSGSPSWCECWAILAFLFDDRTNIVEEYDRRDGEILCGKASLQWGW